jgi:hypothetical protein
MNLDGEVPDMGGGDVLTGSGIGVAAKIGADKELLGLPE